MKKILLLVLVPLALTLHAQVHTLADITGGATPTVQTPATNAPVPPVGGTEQFLKRKADQAAQSNAMARFLAEKRATNAVQTNAVSTNVPVPATVTNAPTHSTAFAITSIPVDPDIITGLTNAQGISRFEARLQVSLFYVTGHPDSTNALMQKMVNEAAVTELKAAAQEPDAPAWSKLPR